MLQVNDVFWDSFVVKDEIPGPVACVVLLSKYVLVLRGDRSYLLARPKRPLLLQDLGLLLAQLLVDFGAFAWFVAVESRLVGAGISFVSTLPL